MGRATHDNNNSSKSSCLGWTWTNIPICVIEWCGSWDSLKFKTPKLTELSWVVALWFGQKKRRDTLQLDVDSWEQRRHHHQRALELSVTESATENRSRSALVALLGRRAARRRVIFPKCCSALLTAIQSLERVHWVRSKEICFLSNKNLSYVWV